MKCFLLLSQYWGSYDYSAYIHITQDMRKRFSLHSASWINFFKYSYGAPLHVVKNSFSKFYPLTVPEVVFLHILSVSAYTEYQRKEL